jgi:hypothetical protein
MHILFPTQSLFDLITLILFDKKYKFVPPEKNITYENNNIFIISV